MKTPLVDFLDRYVERAPTRMHMPGHKGAHGYERDITEISGADSLYHADGIILESERLSGELFGTRCFFSAEGSSLSIRAMLYLVSLYAKSVGKKNRILAARNVHRSFISAAALIGTEVDFFGFGEDYLSATITPDELRELLNKQEEPPVALYMTSPDYLGRVQDVNCIAEVCHENGILLLVDNAHGAYLAFLEKSQHPIALGADMCADSAHKTLPALTGAAYLHISNGAPDILAENAKSALALFGSTSPSYLILESLDRLNGIINEDFKLRLNDTAKLVTKAKTTLSDIGYTVIEGEPMKITVDARGYGYSGVSLGKILEENNIFPEFYDSDYLVLMLSADSTEGELDSLCSVLSCIPKKEAIKRESVSLVTPKRKTSIREAIFSQSERVKVESALGRVLADCAVACPPAVPILVSGEMIDESAIDMFKKYGYDEISVIK